MSFPKPLPPNTSVPIENVLFIVYALHPYTCLKWVMFRLFFQYKQKLIHTNVVKEVQW